jgi:glycerol-3-phosphate O-acyltransferase
LKLGLAGTGLDAFVRTTAQGRSQKVFFVPSTINYLLTLEAETLIDDFLQEEGKARYIIEDDESTHLARVAAFLKKIAGMDGAVVIRFGDPIDCFGNRVDERGESYDSRGRRVDARSYIFDTQDRPRRDAVRDAEYTRELGEVICEAYKRDTVLMPTHLVAASAFEHLRQSVGQGDLFSVLRHRDDVTLPRHQLASDVEHLRDRVSAMQTQGKVVLADSARGVSGSALLDQALRAYAGYHSSPVLEPRGDDLVLQDTRLLFYYQNRLAAHGLGFDALAPKTRPS